LASRSQAAFLWKLVECRTWHNCGSIVVFDHAGPMTGARALGGHFFLNRQRCQARLQLRGFLARESLTHLNLESAGKVLFE
jgi:hypothetical protein